MSESRRPTGEVETMTETMLRCMRCYMTVIQRMLLLELALPLCALCRAAEDGAAVTGPVNK